MPPMIPDVIVIPTPTCPYGSLPEMSGKKKGFYIFPPLSCSVHARLSGNLRSRETRDYSQMYFLKYDLTSGI